MPSIGESSTGKLPSSKDFTKYLNKKSIIRRPDPNGNISKYGSNSSDMISLGLGHPSPDLFPFSKFGFNLAEYDNETDKIKESTFGEEISIGTKTAENSSVEPMGIVLQYGDGVGLRSLVKFFKEHVDQVHKPKYEDWTTVLTVGSTEGFDKICELFLEIGDSVIIDEFTYINAIITLRGHCANFVTVEKDDEGMIPEALDRVCTNWTGERPLRLIYLIPNGQNPTGTTMGIKRRQDIYQICQKHDLIIAEDDPYCFLQFGGLPVVEPSEETEEYFSKLPGVKGTLPSLMSMDVDGRVLRLDTVSKILAPSLRTGWVSGQKKLVDIIQSHIETSSSRANGVSSGMISRLFNDHWGHDGFEKHIIFLQKQYLSRRNVLLKAVEKYLGGMATYTLPDCGMFLWLELNLPPSVASEPGIMDKIVDSMVENNVLLIPGSQSSPAIDAESVKDAPYLRATFARAEKKDMPIAIERLAQVLEKYGCKR
ncbi:hypothetical protein BB559_004225 [Furculomyces boomerangus]|uniref:Aminotransferase class I/classII large domain-containing protein n=2 Tax=Harpellales TaxID=61421 RepID=A0A2T9YFY4_9FUNG|nr:hypothetical protein BB559_004225 [Furculomyces boomerangus]PWA01917.1 hypothetical protein BB558_001947 [Smittium angustum]